MRCLGIPYNLVVSFQPENKIYTQNMQIRSCVLATRFMLVLSLVVSALLLSSTPTAAADFEDEFRKEVCGFIDSLSDDQRASCIHDISDKRRWEMRYPGGKRSGIMIGELDEKQRALMVKVLSMVLSPHGWKMANAVAFQDAEEGGDALGKYWITCYGDPRQGDFAFRLAEHHLTIVHLELTEGEANEFGPILLGANPATLWKEDEQALIHAWSLIENSSALVSGQRAIASEPMKEGDGLLLSSLSLAAQKAIRDAWDQRLSIFTAAIQQRINQIHTRRGGWAKSRLAYYNEEPVSRCVDGGRWDFKCGLPGMVWAFESSRGHIHMSLWASAEGGE
jgi:hypothetical protein